MGKARRGFVYFVSVCPHWVKVGVTANVQKRASTLSLHGKYKVEVHGALMFEKYADAQNAEWFCHSRLRGCRKPDTKEWFSAKRALRLMNVLLCVAPDELYEIERLYTGKRYHSSHTVRAEIEKLEGKLQEFLVRERKAEESAGSLAKAMPDGVDPLRPRRYLELHPNAGILKLPGEGVDGPPSRLSPKMMKKIAEDEARKAERRERDARAYY